MDLPTSLRANRSDVKQASEVAAAVVGSSDVMEASTIDDLNLGVSVRLNCFWLHLNQSDILSDPCRQGRIEF